MATAPKNDTAPEGTPESLKPMGAEEQSRINSASTPETTAGLPNPVDTIDQPLVFANGTVASAAAGDADTTTVFTMKSPNGSTVQVRGTARRDTLLGRGYTAS